MISSRTETTQNLSQSTQKIYQNYNALGVDDKLALLYYLYEEMGDSVTPAAPNAADINLSQPLISELINLSKTDQLEAMRSIVRGDKTDLSQHYGGLTANNQLLVWYAWAEAMGDQVVDMPEDYEPGDTVQQVLAAIKKLDFQEQISLLREAATHMGYSEVGSPESQSQTGKTNSL